VRVLAPDAGGIALAAEALRRGEVVAYPTETVYGLAVDPFRPEAIARLFAAKGRDEGNPILLIVSDASQLSRVALETSPAARSYMEDFWPGPLSLLLPRCAHLPAEVTAGSDKVCVRCPDCAVARQLCDAFGGAITSTSANRSGEPPAQSVEAIDLPGVAIALDGGPLPDSRPSTILDPDSGRVLREGAIAADALRR
jgi:L-threonylcarbamoyladenylate synthase